MARTKQTRRIVPPHVGRATPVLNETVMCIFFSNEWLMDLSLAHLDTAMCNKSLRDVFCKYLAADHVCLTGFDCDDPEFENYFRWLEFRQLKVRQIVLDSISRVQKSEVDVDLESLTFHVDLAIQRSAGTLKIFHSRSGHNIVANSTLNDLFECHNLETVCIEIEETDDLVANVPLLDRQSAKGLFPKLESIRIQNVPGVFVKQVIQGSTHVTNICIEGDFGGKIGDSLSNEVIFAIGSTKFKKLTGLTLRPSTFELPDHDVYCSLSQVCHNLTMFTLHSSGLEDDRLRVILQKCSKVEHLELFNAYAITDDLIHDITTQYCLKLKHLNIGGTPQLTCESIRYALKNCKHLLYLNIMCVTITHDTLTWVSNITSAIPLKTLIMGHCNPDEKEWISFMKDVAPQLQIENWSAGPVGIGHEV